MNTQVSKKLCLCAYYTFHLLPQLPSLFWADQNPRQVQLPLPQLIIVLSTNTGDREQENSPMANMSDLAFNPCPC